jgi:hypothetical protein
MGLSYRLGVAAALEALVLKPPCYYEEPSWVQSSILSPWLTEKDSPSDEEEEYVGLGLLSAANPPTT